MALGAALKTKLLAAIETNTLILLCGAGLSMPPPSYLPCATQVAEICYDKWITIEELNPDVRHDVDKLAGHFHAKGANLGRPLAAHVAFRRSPVEQ